VKTRTKRALGVLLSTFVVGQIVFWWGVQLPTVDVEVPDPGEPVVDGARASLEHGYLEKRDGYWFFAHGGDAVTMGAEHAVLGQFLVQQVESAMFADFAERLPLVLQAVLPPVLMWQYRKMPWAVAPEQREEMWGFHVRYDDHYPLTPWRRGFYYHALHDITQKLVGNPYVDPGVAGACTGFAATGSWTEDGHLLLGRNFDFEVFPLFDEEKVVHLFAREGAIPVLSVSWMAMSGVLSGMNADGIWISLNTAASEGSNFDAPPVSLLVRSVLEQARSIDDVQAMLEAVEPNVSDIYLVGDGKTGEAVVFERGQTKMARRDLVDDRLTAANHLLTDTFAGDTKDAGLREHSSTLARHLRMNELVSEAPLSVERGIAILRDRKGPGGRDLGLGNRNAIDAQIATHGVIADATDRVLWVSTAPHLAGEFRAIDLLAELDAAGHDTSVWRRGLAPGARAWERPCEPSDVGDSGDGVAPTDAKPPCTPPAPPADRGVSDLADPVVRERAQQHTMHLADAEAAIERGDWPQAIQLARRADAAWPGGDVAPRLLGDACKGAGDLDCARAAFTDYLGRYPSFGPGYVQARKWLEEQGALPVESRPDLALP